MRLRARSDGLADSRRRLLDARSVEPDVPSVGSANWSGLASVSDENLGMYYGRGAVNRYQEHLDYWWYNFPSRRSQLVFGSNARAVYEDGTPVSDGSFDPFAKMAAN